MEISRNHEVVGIEDRASLEIGTLHHHSLGRPSIDHVPDGCAPEVVAEQPGQSTLRQVVFYAFLRSFRSVPWNAPARSHIHHLPATADEVLAVGEGNDLLDHQSAFNNSCPAMSRQNSRDWRPQKTLIELLAS